MLHSLLPEVEGAGQCHRQLEALRDTPMAKPLSMPGTYFIDIDIPCRNNRGDCSVEGKGAATHLQGSELKSSARLLQSEAQECPRIRYYHSQGALACYHAKIKIGTANQRRLNSHKFQQECADN